MSGRDWFSLEGTACVVAGAAGLIGRATTQALRDCGADVIAFDSAGHGDVQQLDMTDDGALTALFDGLRDHAADAWGFVNCAYPRTESWGELGFENVSLEDWNDNVALQLGSTFRFSQLAVAFMKERGGGSLVNLGSIYGLGGHHPDLYEGTPINAPAPYAAVKSGVVGLTRYIASMYGGDGIRANAVCPGGVFDGQPETFVERYEARTPLGRMASPEDVAGVIAFLVGPAASYISGQAVAVDGGWTAR